MFRQHYIAFRRFWPGIIWFIIVMVLICTPKKHLPESKFLAKIFFDKLVHIGCFALLVWFFYYPFAKSSLTPSVKYHYLIRLTLCAIVWGLTTEFIQRFFVPGRSFDLLDWLADSVGAVGAFAVVKWWKPKA